MEVDSSNDNCAYDWLQLTLITQNLIVLLTPMPLNLAKHTLQR